MTMCLYVSFAFTSSMCKFYAILKCSVVPRYTYGTICYKRSPSFWALFTWDRHEVRPARFRFRCSVVVSSCLHETGTKLDRHDFVSVAVLSLVAVYMRPAWKSAQTGLRSFRQLIKPKRVSPDRHKLGLVRDFSPVNTNYFQTCLWLNKVHASRVHMFTCSRVHVFTCSHVHSSHVHMFTCSHNHAYNVVWGENVRKEFRIGLM